MKRTLVEDEDKFCACCGDYPVSETHGYYCDLCATAHLGNLKELAEEYRYTIDRMKEQICSALGYIDTMHEIWCHIHEAGELDLSPCNCERDKVIKILEDLL